jgi:hypothetical protein
MADSHRRSASTRRPLGPAAAGRDLPPAPAVGSRVPTTAAARGRAASMPRGRAVRVALGPANTSTATRDERQRTAAAGQRRRTRHRACTTRRAVDGHRRAPGVRAAAVVLLGRLPRVGVLLVAAIACLDAVVGRQLAPAQATSDGGPRETDGDLSPPRACAGAAPRAELAAAHTLASRTAGAPPARALDQRDHRPRRPPQAAATPRRPRDPSVRRTRQRRVLWRPRPARIDPHTSRLTAADPVSGPCYEQPFFNAIPADAQLHAV